MSPVVQAYLAGIGTSLFAVLTILWVVELASIMPARDVRLPTAKQLRREMRARAIKRVA